MGACQGIGAKGEWNALDDVLHTLDHGRSRALRGVEHAGFGAPPKPEPVPEPSSMFERVLDKVFDHVEADPIHNVVTRNVAYLFTGGASELYYMPYYYGKAKEAYERGDTMGFLKNGLSFASGF